MGVGSYFRLLRVTALAVGVGQGLRHPEGVAGGSTWADAAYEAARGARRLVEAGGYEGLSTGVVVAYSIVSVILAAFLPVYGTWSCGQL